MRVFILMTWLALTGFLGACISIWSRRGVIGPYWLLVCTFGSALVWIAQVKDKSMSMTRASILFDVVYGVSYFVGFIMLGEASRWQDVLGLFLCLVGLVIASL